MTDKEMRDLFRDIAVEYPNFIRNENDRATDDKINLYLKEALLTYIWVKSCIKLQDFLLLWAFY